MGEHSKALSYHEQALEIRQKTLPANHPDLATSVQQHGRVLQSHFPILNVLRIFVNVHYPRIIPT